MLYIFIIFFTSAMTSYASTGAGEHTPTPMDLVFPFVNFIILVGFLVLKMRKPLAIGFDKSSDEVKKLYSYAEEKDKEARLKLEMYQNKMKDLPGQEQKIRKEGEAEVNSFKTSLKMETEKTFERIKRDSLDRLEGEKKSLIKNLNAELLEDIIAKAKAKVNSDPALCTKLTNNLSAQIK